MHPSVYDWVSRQVHFDDLANKSVLDVGSLDVNGTVRDLFTGKYTGIDAIDGPNVDRILNAHDLPPSWTRTVDVVVCCEMIEHDDKFWFTLEEICRVLKRGGHLLLTTRGNGFPEHNFPSDYWRFMPASGKLLMNLAGCKLISQEEDTGVYEGITHYGIFLHGVKR